MTGARRILVRTTNWLGDAVMSLPALQALAEAHPQAEIRLLGPDWVKDLYEGESFSARPLVYPKERGLHNLAGKRALLETIRNERFDLAILLQNAFEAAAVARLAGIPERIGYNRDGRGWLLSKAVPVPKEGETEPHERYYYLELLRRAGLIPAYNMSEEIRLKGSTAARARGRQMLAAQGLSGTIVGVNPGAAFGSAKRWFPDRFAAAAVAVLAGREGAVVLFGGNQEVELASQVASLITKAGCQALNLAGKTSLREFIDLTAGCDLSLTNDSGAMHISYAVGTPSVTVFGSTDHLGTGPVGPLARIVRQPVDCSPCKLRECPIDHRCMTRVDANQVALVAIDLLK